MRLSPTLLLAKSPLGAKQRLLLRDGGRDWGQCVVVAARGNEKYKGNPFILYKTHYCATQAGDNQGWGATCA